MIINFSVQNFHCIKDKVTLSFEATSSKELEEYYVVEPKPGLRLLKLGLIYGANASGKTTVLKALEFLRKMISEPLQDKTEVFDFEAFLLDMKVRYENTFFTIEFIEGKIKYLYEIEFNYKSVINEKLYFFNPNKALVYKRTTDIEKQLTEVEFGNKIKISREQKAVLEANTLWNNTVLSGYMKTNVEVYEMRQAAQWFAGLNWLVTPQTNLKETTTWDIHEERINKKNVISILSKADFNISDISIGDELMKKSDGKVALERTTNFAHNQNGETFIIPYENESEGTKRYYGFSGLLDLMIKHELIVPIDELASSLHPELLKHFLLTFLVNSKKSQLIATTHYRELLMEKDIFRNDVVWFTEKKEDGGTDLYSLADFDSSVIRNTSSIYNAYKIGKLGAVPNLSDYYIELEDVEA